MWTLAVETANQATASLAAAPNFLSNAVLLLHLTAAPQEWPLSFEQSYALPLIFWTKQEFAHTPKTNQFFLKKCLL